MLLKSAEDDLLSKINVNRVKQGAKVASFVKTINTLV